MLLQQLSNALSSENYAQARSLLLSLAHEQIDFETSSELLAIWQSIPDRVRQEWMRRTVRIAFISSATQEPLLPLLDMFFGIKRIKTEYWTSGYQIDAIGLMRDPGLEAFKPDICVLQPDVSNIAYWPELACSEEDYRATIKAEAARWSNIAETLKNWLGCEIVQNSVPLLVDQSLGALESRVRGGRIRYINDLNSAMLESLSPDTRWMDIAALSARSGTRNWRDIRLWHHAKLGVALDAAAAYSYSLASLVAAGYGATRKCLVVDLDNTLWGGVVGDDGSQNLIFGEGSGNGEAFKAFQIYIRRLKNQGVLLAVCSKNDEDVARSAFEDMEESVLRASDFDAFFANWDRKSDNITAIAKHLNIGIDSLVFFDDNPVEREEVRFAHPDVLVIDVPEDPALFCSTLAAYHAFEPASLTTDDLERSKFYRTERDRENFAAQTTDYEEYLSDLQMEAQIAPFDVQEMARIAQLINKTNQFNLTTKRYTQIECEKFMDTTKYLTRYMRLKDRFGNYGLISVFIGQIDEAAGALDIDTWLMSCRVLKRGVEAALLANVLKACQKQGIQTVYGTYAPTKSNGLVKSLLADMGFRLEQEIGGGATRWRMQSPFTHPKTHVREIANRELVNSDG